MHTPDSYVSEFGDNWDTYVNALKSSAREHDVSVMAVTDYFSVNGYERLLGYASSRTQSPALELSEDRHLYLFPAVELRVDHFTSDRAAVNIHVIFDPKLRPETIRNNFLSQLKVQYKHSTLPLTEDTIIKIGHAESEADAAFDVNADVSRFNSQQRQRYRKVGLGLITLATRDVRKSLLDLRDLLKDSTIGHDCYFVIVANKGHGGLSDFHWYKDDTMGRAGNVRQTLLNSVDACFSNDSKDREFLLGKTSATPAAEIIRRFGCLKPCVWGSDAHATGRLFTPNGNPRHYTWVKSNPTFQGLRQIMFEPESRVHIGERPTNLKQPFRTIRSLQIRNSNGWFSDCEIPINEDLAAVIGGRGSGKSAFAELLAFAGGSRLFSDSESIQDSFLSKASERSSSNLSPITGTTVSLTWADGSCDLDRIIKLPATESGEEKVKYLPQKFVERLCAPNQDSALQAEIERIIFSNLPESERLEASSFYELRRKATAHIQLKRASIAQTLAKLHQAIAAGTSDVNRIPVIERDLEARRQELEILRKSAPTVPDADKADLDRLSQLAKTRSDIEKRVAAFSDQLNTLGVLRANVEIMTRNVESYNIEIGKLLEQVNMSDSLQAFRMSVPQEPLLLLERRQAELKESIHQLRKGDGVTSSSLDSIEAELSKIRNKVQIAEERSRELELYQKEVAKLEDHVRALESQVEDIKTRIVPGIGSDIGRRDDLYAELMGLLRAEQEVLEKLYRPLTRSLAEAGEETGRLSFACHITVDDAKAASSLFEILDGRSAVYSPDEFRERLRELSQNLSIGQFTSAAARAYLSEVRVALTAQSSRPKKIQEQLRKGKSVIDFDMWLYSGEEFAVSYTLLFNNKELRLLSPGEKGIVLLLLYLKVEKQDTRPLIIDQPEDNLDNMSVYPELVKYFREGKVSRQLIVITHNPNLVVNTDAEQVIVPTFDGARNPKIQYRSGALEESCGSGGEGIRELVCRILEGGTEAFRKREEKYALVVDRGR